jgi:hypothetical protein
VSIYQKIAIYKINWKIINKCKLIRLVKTNIIHHVITLFSIASMNADSKDEIAGYLSVKISEFRGLM